MSNRNGGPAFPRTPAEMDGWRDGALGMSLRDWFAGKALAALIAEPVEGIKEAMAFDLCGADAEAFAAAAYKFADAMLKARNA
jgi:hypothetical protein